MKQEDTKQKILDKALELFSEYGYDSVSVGQIAQAVGIKAPSLADRFPGKQAIFDAIVESTAARYAEGTDRLSVHVQDARRDVPRVSQITADELFRQTQAGFPVQPARRADKPVPAHDDDRAVPLAGACSAVFPPIRRAAGRLSRGHIPQPHCRRRYADDPEALAMMYVAPVITLIGICDREPEREAECLEKLRAHTELFFRAVHA